MNHICNGDVDADVDIDVDTNVSRLMKQVLPTVINERSPQKCLSYAPSTLQ